MWTCLRCGEICEDQFNACWRCSTVRNQSSAEPLNTSTATASLSSPVEEPVAAERIAAEEGPPQWTLKYKMFRGTLATWDELFNQAAEFATQRGPDRIANISHSADNSDGVVVVWYWVSNQDPPPAYP